MNEVDPIRVRNLLGSISEARGRLAELGRMPKDEFLADYRNTESAKYLLLVATEAAIDLCNHIAARRGGRAPHDYADCFAILVDRLIITADLGQRLQRMARFRNLLVHLYDRVDNGRVYSILQDHLSDFDDFRDQILAWLVSLSLI